MITLPVSYTTVSAVNSAFPMLSSVANITSAVVAIYAGFVEAEINGKIASRYPLPLTVECPMLSALATRETIYRLVANRALIQFPGAQQGQSAIYATHKEDQELIKMIMDGVLKLVDASGAQISWDTANAIIYSTTQNYEPTMHEGPWADMIQDPNKLNDIELDRDL